MLNYCLLFVIQFHRGERESVFPGLCCLCFPGVPHGIGTHLFVLSNGTQAGLEPEAAGVVVAAVAAAARNGSKFSQCNLTWRGFPQTKGSGCQKSDSGWCFIST
jgi:hypothetical protein